MSITIGFVLIFILIIIPGLLFQRFYYFGEFSKQFNTKDTVYKSIFYSVIPGILIQLLGALIYFLVHKSTFENDLIFSVFYEISNPPEKGMSTKTIEFINNGIYLFLIHLLNIYFLSIFIGYSLTRLVRYFKLDKFLKILRFKNQWYYIFSGEILDFSKFKNVNKILGEVKGEYNKFKHYPPHADILVDTNSGTTCLYSGYVIDYDLDSNNINNLDKIYLIGTHRYRDKRETDSQDIIHGSRAKIKVKGSVFVLTAKNIQTINLTLIPKPVEEDIVVEEKKGQVLLKYIYRTLIVFKFASIFYIYKIDYDFLGRIFPKLTLHLSDSGFFQKFFMVLIVIQLLSVISPELKDEKIEEDNNQPSFFEYNTPDFIGKVVILAVFIILYWFIYF
ncbi:hypothetical protein [Tenacibaculum maritimum]|uniref:hypothetical protein n=1 Tax=Tenacibaculum maritimum TaxID=107401 RepID=UPI0012E6131B|nr:hypothetical protein [Tenacibaculum maritimum]CAA0236521.1 conserved membrane hypothetical protein [Tenacibaculum maritimum]